MRVLRLLGAGLCVLVKVNDGQELRSGSQQVPKGTADRGKPQPAGQGISLGRCVMEVAVEATQC